MKMTILLPITLLRNACGALLLAMFLLVSHCTAAQLRPETVTAFNQYVKQTEARQHSDLHSAYLYVDSLPPAQRDEALRKLHAGEFYIEPLKTTADGQPIPIPGGMIHHWVGIVFVPGANMKQTLQVTQNYDHREKVYPDVLQSKLLARDGDDFKVFMRLYKKKMTTVVYNSDYDIQYYHLDATHVYCNSYTTRIAQVVDPNNPDGPEMPVGEDSGYLWRLYTYWRFLEKDDGVYIQVEAVSLTRNIPYGLEWMLGPMVKSIPKESFTGVLERTKYAIEALAKK
jgi:hypothetical protein